jgi:spore photoproduct lyase
VCCGYRIIDAARGCRIGCSYCILSHYYGGGGAVVFKNWDKLFVELEESLANAGGFARFGTGEFTDSLAFRELDPLYRELIPFFSRKKNAALELKTKTTNVEPLLAIAEHANVLVAWSLNSEHVSRREEKAAPGVMRRLEAARRVQDAGYSLAFHFDPIVLHEGWKEGYRRTVDALFGAIRPGSIVYVSLGALRFPPGMREPMRAAGAGYLAGEFVRGLDDKMRYFRPLRVEAYRFLVSCLADRLQRDVLYLCMESPTVWEDVFGVKGMCTEKLTARLNEACGNVLH